ncbi:hypothetical protein [Aeromonas veronii]|uniref:hypothetical protein n=1 Tax=Aeromonas veronii TaxID=654 RepID=UPI002417A45E|nr:hypothetical protein [Aeromonas veronii]WFO49868.1 hypothetical protein L1O00_12600 [Aeromonas veronii]
MTGIKKDLYVVIFILSSLVAAHGISALLFIFMVDALIYFDIFQINASTSSSLTSSHTIQNQPVDYAVQFLNENAIACTSF